MINQTVELEEFILSKQYLIVKAKVQALANQFLDFFLDFEEGLVCSVLAL